MNTDQDLHGHCLLVVDDEPNNLSVMVDYLRAYGFEIMTARTGLNGLGKAQRGLPDLILLDVMLPDIDGFEVCRRLQADETTRGIPVIFLTALTQMEDKLKGFEVGGVDYLTKPIQEAEVLARVTTHLKLRNLQNRLRERNRELQQEIEQRKRVEEELRQAKLAAEHANHSKSAFLANMSHEIRTPLNAVLGFSEILAGVLQEPRHKDYLHAIQVSGHTLLNLINDILDLSKIEAGKLEVIYREIDPRPLFEDMAVIFSQKLQQKQLQFIVEIAPDFPQALRLDETRMRQILLNLVGNAVKFTRHGFIKVTVWHRYLDEQTLDLHFSVEDSGTGIAADEQERMFAAFEQSRKQDRNEYGGTGLGLAIVKRLVEMLGGHIELHSQEGQGSTFTVHLHRISMPPDSMLPSRTPAALTGLAQIEFAPATLLLVDDIKLNRDLLREYLHEYAFTFIEADGADEALRLAEGSSPDLIIFDTKHDIASACAEIQRFKTAPPTAALPLIAVGAAQAEDMAKIAVLSDAYIGKPLGRTELVRAIMPFLRHNPPSGAAVPDRPPAVTANAAPPALAEYLRRRVSPQWQALDANASINDIEAFAAAMHALGQEYAYAPLVEWAAALQNQAALFDMGSLFQTLQAFSEFITPPR